MNPREIPERLGRVVTQGVNTVRDNKEIAVGGVIGGLANIGYLSAIRPEGPIPAELRGLVVGTVVVTTLVCSTTGAIIGAAIKDR